MHVFVSKNVLHAYIKTAKYIGSYSKECVRNLDLRVQVHPGELWVSKSAGAHLDEFR